MSAEEPTYEGNCVDEVSALDRARSAHERSFLWPPDQRSIALARDADSRLEIFIVGPPLDATLRVVADVLEYNVWSTDEGGLFQQAGSCFPAVSTSTKWGLSCVSS